VDAARTDRVGGAVHSGSGLALAGAAIGNVLMPTPVKRYFPERTGAMTALYTTAIAVGMTGGAALTGPAERAFGGDWQAAQRGCRPARRRHRRARAG
ncbi:MAG: hypothetical protein M3Z25_21270, partial [Actinomycetota bacterium]|nr:hypothetical protein [Actinomycetota bacterium]